jgi:mycofactocin precursor
VRRCRAAPGSTLDVMEHDTIAAAPAVDTALADPAVEVDEQLIEDELLIEEISIDGMCGVY